MFSHHLNLRHAARVLAVLAVVGLAVDRLASDASAQTSSFSFELAAYEAILINPNDPILQNLIAWDSPLVRLVARSRPFIEVTNDAASAENLTNLDITIGDTAFGFGDSIFGGLTALGATSTPGVGIASATTPDGGDTLQVSFANGGLAPGETIRFQIDIDPDTATQFIHPDFRTVLFDVFEFGNAAGASDLDNATFTGTFANGLSSGSVVPDQVLPLGVPFFANGNIRPYSIEEAVIVFEGDPGVVIPEPSTAMLCLVCAGLGGAAVRRRRR